MGYTLRVTTGYTNIRLYRVTAGYTGLHTKGENRLYMVHTLRVTTN